MYAAAGMKAKVMSVINSVYKYNTAVHYCCVEKKETLCRVIVKIGKDVKERKLVGR